MVGYRHDKDRVQQRLRRIEGQIRGLQRMVDEDAYCIDVLTQISAATKALQAVALALLDDHLNHCVAEHLAGRLTATDAAMVKWWTTDLQNEVADACLQMHGGYGYMSEYPIARMWADSRVQRIYAGANEIMKELVARGL